MTDESHPNERAPLPAGAYDGRYIDLSTVDTKYPLNIHYIGEHQQRKLYTVVECDPKFGVEFETSKIDLGEGVHYVVITVPVGYIGSTAWIPTLKIHVYYEVHNTHTLENCCYVKLWVFNTQEDYLKFVSQFIEQS